jgi:ABC-2 type transport system ATP-binding protein
MPPPPAPALEIRNLRKRFGSKTALDDVSFRITRGEIYGLLGHNGAGKSTTLGIILGMVGANSGSVLISGIDVTTHHARALARIGAIFETPAFYDYLSGWDNLRILMGYSGGFDADAAGRIVDRVGLARRIHSRVATYSHGMRQRLALAQALLPEPVMLLLDEPTDGLDPEGIKWFRDFILELRADRGITVLFNSHQLAEVEQMCDRVAILRNGRRVFEGPVRGLAEDRPVFEVDLTPWGTACGIVASHHGEIIAPGRVSLPAGADPAALVATLVGAGVAVRAFAPVRRSLEDLYLEISRSCSSSPNSVAN